MNEFKYQFVNLLLLVLLGTGVYWAFTNIDNGIVYDKDVVVSDKNINEEKEEIVLFDNTKKQEEQEIKIETKESDKPATDIVKEESNSNDNLISKLQKLADKKVNINTGSNGDDVGYVQEFLAIYFKDKKISIDKSFGPTTKGLVKQFQTSELNGGDGRVGPNTLKAMIKFLNK